MSMAPVATSARPRSAHRPAPDAPSAPAAPTMPKSPICAVVRCHGAVASGSAIDPHAAPKLANISPPMRLRTRKVLSRMVSTTTDAKA